MATLISPTSTSNAATLTSTNLQSMAAGLQSGSFLMPTLNVVQAVMNQMFGGAQYSTLPTNAAALAGKWNITTQMSNNYVSVTPLQQSQNTSATQATSNNLALVTCDIVTNSQGTALNGYLSLVQPNNYIIYTPFPCGSITNPALLPVAGVGLQIGANSISMVNFPYGVQSYWSRVQGLSLANTAMSNAIMLTNNSVIPITTVPGSPAGIAAQLNITPTTIQNVNAATQTASTTQTLPAQLAFSQMPLASSLASNLNSNTSQAALNAMSLAPKMRAVANAGGDLEAKKAECRGRARGKRAYSSKCSCPDCHAFRKDK